MNVVLGATLQDASDLSLLTLQGWEGIISHIRMEGLSLRNHMVSLQSSERNKGLTQYPTGIRIMLTPAAAMASISAFVTQLSQYGLRTEAVLSPKACAKV
jgi:hypothetical protein